MITWTHAHSAARANFADTYCRSLLFTPGAVQNLLGDTDVTTLAGGTQTITGGPVASQEVVWPQGAENGLEPRTYGQLRDAVDQVGGEIDWDTVPGAFACGKGHPNAAGAAGRATCTALTRYGHGPVRLKPRQMPGGQRAAEAGDATEIALPQFRGGQVADFSHVQRHDGRPGRPRAVEPARPAWGAQDGVAR
ncbi:hypothetical protein ACSNOB_03105 [Micromonospora sp. URMC 106]|uniref:hypothetical protein n=1 Tax=Micromonospora sp. URMC 106 TaxID=3423408 RepID=UPI003F1C9C28